MKQLTQRIKTQIALAVEIETDTYFNGISDGNIEEMPKFNDFVQHVYETLLVTTYQGYDMQTFANNDHYKTFGEKTLKNEIAKEMINQYGYTTYEN